MLFLYISCTKFLYMLQSDLAARRAVAHVIAVYATKSDLLSCIIILLCFEILHTVSQLAEYNLLKDCLIFFILVSVK